MIYHDYYRVLGVDEHAGTDEILEAFRHLARGCHGMAVSGDQAMTHRFKGTSPPAMLCVWPSQKEWPKVLPCVALGCSALLWAALRCSGLLWAALGCSGLLWAALGCSGLLWAALGCSGLLWAALGWVNLGTIEKLGTS
jgi:hypothetical protein